MHTSLRQLYDARAQLVPFVGTGVSIQASGVPEASWPGLLRSGVEEVSVFCPDLPPGWRDTALARLDHADLYTYLAIGDEVHRRLDAEGHFTTWLRQVGAKIQLQDRTVLEPLTSMSNLAVTTNYDLLIEQAFEAGGKAARTIEIGDFPSFRATEIEQRPAVLHIHGSAAGSVVLSASQYQQIELDKAAQAIQAVILGTKQFLFVGVGEGLNDPNVGSALDLITGYINGTDYPHFLLVRGEELPHARHLHKGRPITPIAYGANYDDLAPFLEALVSGSSPEVSQDPDSYGRTQKELLTGVLNIASFAEDRLDDLEESSRRAERALGQIASRLELTDHFAQKRPSDQLVILQQQAASIQGPLARLVQATATIAASSESTEAQLAKLAADRAALRQMGGILCHLGSASSPLHQAQQLAASLAAELDQRRKQCQELSEPAETAKTVHSRLTDSAQEISGLIEQLQEPDAPSLAQP